MRVYINTQCRVHHIYKCIYIYSVVCTKYICIYTYIYIYIHVLCMDTYTYIWSLYVHMYIYTHIYITIYTSLHTYKTCTYGKGTVQCHTRK